jgi:hypothetical protein
MEYFVQAETHPGFIDVLSDILNGEPDVNVRLSSRTIPGHLHRMSFVAYLSSLSRYIPQESRQSSLAQGRAESERSSDTRGREGTVSRSTTTHTRTVSRPDPTAAHPDTAAHLAL